MYDLNRSAQFSLTDFNQSLGMKLDPKNEWVVAANRIPWATLEADYAALFKSREGNVALSFRMMFGASIIKTRMNLSDRKLVRTIKENPYYQYFIGLPGITAEEPFSLPSLTNFRKRCSYDVVGKINNLLVEIMESLPDAAPKRGRKPASPELTLILDATCSPEDIRFPQDESLLNEAREKLEAMIDGLFEQLRYVARNIGHVEAYVGRGLALTEKQRGVLEVIKMLYTQQKAMYDGRTHRVENRIVSLSQPHIRPIVRGKAKSPVEFGPKYDVSVDEKGFARMERISFDAYNESAVLKSAVARYIRRTGRAPARILVDQIYRTSDNISFCGDMGIRLSGPKLGRPPRETSPKARATACKDNVDRIEVERRFSLTKQSYGLSVIRTRLPETEMFSIGMGILVSNLFTTGLARLFCINRKLPARPVVLKSLLVLRP